MKNRKSYDCVEMKLQAAEKVQARLATMTPDELQAYWDQLTYECQQLEANRRQDKHCVD